MVIFMQTADSRTIIFRSLVSSLKILKMEKNTKMVHFYFILEDFIITLHIVYKEIIFREK